VSRKQIERFCKANNIKIEYLIYGKKYYTHGVYGPAWQADLLINGERQEYQELSTTDLIAEIQEELNQQPADAEGREL
jgi:hypothetical protein